MLLSTVVLSCCLLTVSAGYSCSNRLYRGQRLYASQPLCSKNQNYRMLQNSTGHVIIKESFPRENYYGPPPQLLFSTNNATTAPSYMALSDSGDLTAVDADNTVYWRANVSGADFLELQDTGRAALFAKNTSMTQVLWKSLSTYSLRLVNGTADNAGRLEFYFNDTWGSVSYSGFTVNDANVACRTLGYDTGQMVTNTFGQSSGPMWMDNVNCNGREDVFQECAFGQWRTLPPRYWWGIVLDSNHIYDVAVSCQGNSSLGVLPPTAHVCTDRLFVGQALSLSESLCAGQNGEFTLRFTNKRTDALIELWNKTERKWILGMISQQSAYMQLRMDIDGVLRIIEEAANSTYNVYNDTVANASFMELQDNGVCQIVSVNGTIGWMKAPEDFCYKEQQNIRSSDNRRVLSSLFTSSPLVCLNACILNPNCTTVVLSNTGSSCVLYSGFPWDMSTSNSTYYEKLPGCASGFNCYVQYLYDRWNIDPYLASSNTIFKPSGCTDLCDSTPKCISAYFSPSTNSCFVNYKRLNDSVACAFWSTFYKKTPCITLDPSQVPVLPVKECPKKLYPGSFFRPRDYICSPSGRHVVTFEKDTRLVIDGGKWTSNNGTNLSGYLEYTYSNQLFLRLDDGSVAWKADSTSNLIKNDLFGYVALSDDGKLQMYDALGLLIWDHEGGYQVPLVPLKGGYNFNEMQLIDGNTATCVNGTATAMFQYRLRPTSFNMTFGIGLVGQNLRCGTDSAPSNYVFMTSQGLMNDNGYPGYGNERTCKLQTASSQECHFECHCENSFCTVLSLWYLGCGLPDGTLCEVSVD